MQRHVDYTRDRLRQLADRLWEKVYPNIRPLDSILVSNQVDRITYDQAQQIRDWHPAKKGDQFGPLWATYWFRAAVTVPNDWKGKRVDLLWSTHSEGTLWLNGNIAQGLNSDGGAPFNGITRQDAILLRKAHGGENLEFQIEVACNRLFGYDGHLNAPMRDLVSPYLLERADIAALDPEAWDLYYDYVVLQELEAEQTNDLDKTWGGLLLSELNRFANTYDPADRATWPQARAILKALYANHNATSVHELSAIGHAHIDTAWLWPLAETRRKCERSFSTAVAYMDDYPNYKFSCSQAYQYDLIKKHDPNLYSRIAAKVKAGQFVPVGGTWIEPDCNLPSGESLCRQFIYGQRFFEEEFGIRCREFWNPDVFGYNGQLPQIMRLAGITRFLTQKLSWNRFNKPHHHTFIWEGIDGSEVITHFPPADTYNADASVKQLRENARNYKDHDRSRHSLMLFGWGDGGGGPTKKMLEYITRAKDLQGLPRTQIRSSAEFFELLEKDNTDRVKMVGELYFEYHRGTYTTQAATKKGNRKNEFLLHDVEFASLVASRTGSHKYPTADLDRLWRVLLLNQFHDILPGSSITEVYEDAARDHAMISRDATKLFDTAIRSLVGTGSKLAVVNTTPFDRAEVVTLPDGTLAFAAAPSYGVGRLVNCEDQVAVSEASSKIVLENKNLRATLSKDGSVVSLIEKSTGREALAAPGNQLLLYPDTPINFDAWDVDPFHMEKETPALPAESCKIIEKLPLRSSVSFERKIGRSSTLRQIVRLSADARALVFDTEVDWHEDHTMLKVAFPVNVRAMNATYEMQFGCVERPTHFNTMYDLARYEVPGHKWSDLSEPGFGVAILSESKHGYSTFGNTMRLSLLRAPTYPDPKADRGTHHFSYAIYPHAGGWREAGVVAEGYKFNVPLRTFAHAKSDEISSFVSVDSANFVLDTIKAASDGDGVILRSYEAHGARGLARIRLGFPFKVVRSVNLLEEEISAVEPDGEVVSIQYTPYQIVTLKVR
jgi:alpha-mannosidase